MAEINFLQSGQVFSSGVKSEQTTVASKDDKAVLASEKTPMVENSPAGKNAISSIEAVSQVGPEEINSMMDALNAQLEKLNNYLRFEKHEDTDRMVVMIKDAQTDEVIRQIPSEEFLAVSKNISDYLDARKQMADSGSPIGLLTNEQV